MAVAFVSLRDTPVQAAAPIKARATPAAKIAPGVDGARGGCSGRVPAARSASAPR